MQCFVHSKAHPSVAAAGPQWSNSLVILSQCVADSAKYFEFPYTTIS